MTSSKQSIGIIILAAGGSKRMGSPKQLLQFKGESLVRRVAKIALESDCAPVIVVLGNEFESISKQLSDLSLVVVNNSKWAEGLSSSMTAGIQKLKELRPEIEGVMIILADQPYIHPAYLNKMITAFENSGKGIIATNYGDSPGVPALFHRKYFGEIIELQGDEGAKKVIKRHLEDVEVLIPDFDLLDVDTVEEYGKLEDGKYNKL